MCQSYGSNPVSEGIGCAMPASCVQYCTVNGDLESWISWKLPVWRLGTMLSHQLSKVIDLDCVKVSSQLIVSVLQLAKYTKINFIFIYRNLHNKLWIFACSWIKPKLTGFATNLSQFHCLSMGLFGIMPGIGVLRGLSFSCS